MGSPGYEYGFLVQSSPLPDGFPKLVGDQPGQILGEHLSRLVEPLGRTMGTLDGGGWEAVSHSALIANGSLIVTFLIRRRSVPRG